MVTDKMLVQSPKDNRRSAKQPSKVNLDKIEGAAKTFYGLVRESITNLNAE